MTAYALISCVKTKGEKSARALELYTSPLFRKSLLYALQRNQRPVIISAKYGLLFPDCFVSPYEQTLPGMSKEQKTVWKATVRKQLAGKISNKDVVYLYAGREYLQNILPNLSEIGCHIQIPLTGSLGQRLSQLREVNAEFQLEKQWLEIKKINKLLDKKSWQGQPLDQLSANVRNVPKRGLYFFVDSLLPSTDHSLGRIVRVGTHAVSKGAKSTLATRLGTHRGAKHGGGSHRSSVFRLHVGNALMSQSPNTWFVPTWASGSTAPKSIREKEFELEQAASEHIGQLLTYWLDIPDDAGPESDRAYVEQNLIGLLSCVNLLKGYREAKWLGSFSTEYKISLSGLWNLNHLFLVPDESFVDVYRSYVESTIGTRERIQTSIAPQNWRERSLSCLGDTQLELFDR